MRGVEQLQQVLEEDSRSSGNSRTTRAKRPAAAVTTPQSPQAASQSNIVEEHRYESMESISEGAASPPASQSSHQPTGRRHLFKTVIRENIARVEAAIKRLETIKSKACTAMVTESKGTASYDSAATELEETVRKLQSIDLA